MTTSKLPPLPELPMDRVQNFSTPVSWGISNPQRFQELMEELKTLVSPGYYLSDNLFTWGRNNSAFEDAAFVQALSANIQNPADQAIAWRRYLLACSACHSASMVTCACSTVASAASHSTSELRALNVVSTTSRL